MAARVLVVEDESSIADVVTYALTSEGYTPSWCRTGAQALEQFKSTEVDLVILDVGLPDVNGFDLARALRGLRPVPLIFLTARSGEVDRVAGLEMGADDYVVKPFSPRELTARVRAVLRRITGPAAPVAAPVSGDAPTPARVFGPFELDEMRHRIRYHGRDLDLARLEFRLLAVLISQPGRVFTRDQLLEMAWEGPSASLDRTVDTHMKTLRRKLRAVKADVDPIETHRGVGYSLHEG